MSPSCAGDSRPVPNHRQPKRIALSLPKTDAPPYNFRKLAVILVWMLVLAAGCVLKPQPQRLLRVTVRYPGATAQDVESNLAIPVESTLAASPDINSITSICSTGKLEAYVAIERGAVAEEVVARIATELDRIRTLPDSALGPVVELLPTSATIPIVEPTLVDEVVLDMNTDATLEHGVSIHDLATLLQAADIRDISRDERLEKLRQLRVRTADNSLIPLTELGELRIKKTPDKTIRTWP